MQKERDGSDGYGQADGDGGSQNDSGGHGGRRDMAKALPSAWNLKRLDRNSRCFAWNSFSVPKAFWKLSTIFLSRCLRVL